MDSVSMLLLGQDIIICNVQLSFIVKHNTTHLDLSKLGFLINMDVMLTESGGRDVTLLFPCLSKQHLLLNPLSLFPNLSLRLLNACTMEGNGLPLMHAITSRPAVIDAKGRQIYSNLSSTVPVHSVSPPIFRHSTPRNFVLLLFCSSCY